MGVGPTLPAENALIAWGLQRAGYGQQAREIARRYCSGRVPASSPAFSADVCFGSSVDAACFQLLALLACPD